MFVIIAGETRTWEPLPITIAECPLRGSRAFRRSKLTKHWHCKECNEEFADEKPWWKVITCSRHGQQLQPASDEQSYWFLRCEEDDSLRSVKPAYDHEIVYCTVCSGEW
jgi:hypothetical protein